MTSSSQKGNGNTTFEVQLVSNEVKKLEFKAIPKVVYKNDPIGALSMIPPQVVMIQDVCKC